MPLETFSNLEPLDTVRNKINATITAVNDLQSAGSASWGNISGILADQLDLQNALDLKANISALDLKQDLTLSQSSLTYATTVNLDLAVLTGKVRTISLAGNLTLTASNLANGRHTAIRLISDSSVRTLSFPTGWKFLGSGVPASIAANKTAVLSVTFFGNTNSDAVCSYAVEL